MDIILHLGAHKTASTYLQKRMARSSGRLKRYQAVFHGPKSLRPRIGTALGKDKWLPRREAQARRAACLADLIRQEEAAGTQRLILSEEQFLGSLRDMIAGRDFYEDAEHHIEPIARVLQDRPVQVLVSVRGYAKFLASVYGQVIRGWRFVPFDAKLRSQLLNQSMGWPELVESVLGLFPHASRVTLWRYEDFRRVETQVIEAMAGPAAPEIRPLDERPLSAPSQTAIDMLHQKAAIGPPDRNAIHNICDAKARDIGFPEFDPWTEEERSYLDGRYRQDLIWLYRLTDCTWLNGQESPTPALAASRA